MSIDCLGEGPELLGKACCHFRLDTGCRDSYASFRIDECCGDRNSRCWVAFEPSDNVRFYELYALGIGAGRIFRWAAFGAPEVIEMKYVCGAGGCFWSLVRVHDGGSACHY